MALCSQFEHQVVVEWCGQPPYEVKVQWALQIHHYIGPIVALVKVCVWC
jgi:hypothetical protein